MASYILLLWIFFTTPKFIDNSQLISATDVTEVQEGNPFNLTCQISSPILGCNWQRSRDYVTISPTSSSYHYVIFGNNSNGECGLFIKQTVRTDDGRWRCLLTLVNESTTISTDVKLTVLPQAEQFVYENRVIFRPGVIVGSLCAFIFAVGGLITIYFYKSKNSCCLAPPGYSSRSMLVRNPSSQIPDQGFENDENGTRLLPSTTNPESETFQPSDKQDYA